jgi:hypothetical protein
LGIVVPFKAGSLLLNLCNRSIISATAASTTGTDFLESCVGWPAVVLEFYGCPRKMPNVISFMEMKKA